MNSRTISAICIRLLAIYLLVSVAIALPSIWAMYINLPNMMSGVYPNIWTAIGLSLSTLIIGLTCFWGIWKSSAAVLAKVSDTDSVSAISMTSGYELLGVYFLVSGLAYTPDALLQCWRFSSLPDTDLFHYVQTLAEPILLVVAGAVLAKHSIAVVYKKLKYAGL